MHVHVVAWQCLCVKFKYFTKRCQISWMFYIVATLNFYLLFSKSIFQNLTELKFMISGWKCGYAPLLLCSWWGERKISKTELLDVGWVGSEYSLIFIGYKTEIMIHILYLLPQCNNFCWLSFIILMLCWFWKYF